MQFPNNDKLKKCWIYCLELLEVTRKWPSYLYRLSSLMNHYPQPRSKPLLKKIRTLRNKLSVLEGRGWGDGLPW